MELELNLSTINAEERLSFCNYLIQQLSIILNNLGEQPSYEKMEEYINNNNIINWQIKNNNYISVYDLYRLAVNNLEITNSDEIIFSIHVNPNVNIPNSYTRLHSIISLLEFGTLSVKKCGVLGKYMGLIAKDLDIYYKSFLIGGMQ